MAQRLILNKKLYKNILDGLINEQRHGTWNVVAVTRNSKLFHFG